MKTNKKKEWSLKAWLNTESVAGYVFTLPLIIGFLFFIMVPMVTSMYYSFCSYNVLKPETWVGLNNFTKMFADEDFYTSLWATFKFALVSVPLKLAFALLVALVLLRNTKLTPVYRAAYYLPSILGSSVAVAILWKRMFSVDGLINKILGTDIVWLGQPGTAMWVIIILAVWQFGSSMLIFLSAMKQIPSSLYEAARVDGAGPVRSFFKITMPLLTPTIFFNLVMQTINGFTVFAQGQIITDGKPMNSTLFYVLYMYKQSFEFSNVGYAAAMGWLLISIMLAYTGILFFSKRYWVYEE